MRKSQPNLTTKLAATLLQLRGDDGQPIISYEHAKLMSAEQICSLFQFDHYPIREADGGPCEPWNLQPLLIMAHRIKTGTKDKPELAKQARIRGETCTGPKKEIRNRVNAWPPKGSRKLQSQGFERRA